MTRRLIRILLSAALFAAGLLVKEPPALRLFLLLGAYALAGWDVLWYAVHHLINGQVFDENLLMSIATVGAIAIGEYPEATAVMLFYQVGELFQSYAVDRSRRSIAELMDLRPEEALLLSDGRPVSVSPEEVQPGQLILVRPGDRIPLDGVVRDGGSSLDTAALTGEAMPRDAGVGDAVLSGAINLTAPLTIEVSAPYGESTVARILDLVENASNRKSQSETFITRFSAVYTPVVVILAALLAAVPPLLFGQPFQPWLYRALQFLVVSCPCALVVSIPLSFFGGIGGAGRQGILVKGSNYLEALAQADQVVFDKTGTLTQGVFAVTRVMPRGMSREELLRLAAHAEAHSAHPIAQSLRAAWGQAIDFKRVTDVQETGGRGLQAMVDGRPVLAGNAAWMAENGLTPEAAEAAGTLIHIAADGRYAGSILIADQVKPQAAQAVQALHAIGVRRIAMLTGDSEAAARLTAKQIGIDEVHHSLLPQDKVALVDGMLAQKARGKLCFVGDGINDAPVLARADVGVAMGGLGSGAAIEAADIVLMDDNPMKLPLAIRIARKTLRIAQQNAVFAIGVKVVVLALSALGYASLWSAVFADVGVTALAVLNALRTLRKTV
ncbi:MAG: cadmium-translocating P-type ATPase [Clostridiales bacterium]|nr:cadmium-translocating P-type ATPase [Clostridiales bacterium]